MSITLSPTSMASNADVPWLDFLHDAGDLENLGPLCVALCSYFYSILPTKRNLLTYLNSLFVIAMTAIVNIMVSESSDLEI